MLNTQPKSVEEVMDRAMIRVTIAVGKELLDGNVLLLPDVHNKFCTYANELITANGISDTVNMPNSRRVISNLISSLKHHDIACNSKTRKYGTSQCLICKQ